MAGHSIGGAAAIAAMLADSRIRAGIDIPQKRRDHLGAGLGTPDRLEAVARGDRRSEPQALLDQPSRRYPEVTFCSP
jgi:hypothetical protein